MATEHLARGVGVHTTLVGEEVLVHGERSLNGAIGHDLSGDLGLVAGNGVGRGTVVLVLL